MAPQTMPSRESDLGMLWAFFRWFQPSNLLRNFGQGGISSEWNKCSRILVQYKFNFIKSSTLLVLKGIRLLLSWDYFISKLVWKYFSYLKDLKVKCACNPGTIEGWDKRVRSLSLPWTTWQFRKILNQNEK